MTATWAEAVYLLPRPDPCRKRVGTPGRRWVVGPGQPGIRSPAERSPACAVPEKPRSTRFPQAVPRVSCAAMGVRQCAVRGAAVTLTVLELFELFDSAMKVSTSTINVMVCAPGLVGSSRTDCCH